MRRTYGLEIFHFLIPKRFLPATSVSPRHVEPVMTPWWVDVIEKEGMVPLPAEDRALDILSSKLGLSSNTILLDDA
jgi:hypothetical protein